MDEWTFFIELPEFFKKYSRSWYSLIIPLVLSIYFYTSFYGEVVFNICSYKVDLSIILILLVFVIWGIVFYLSRRKLKNTSKLPGVGIFLGESILPNNSLSRKRFIRDMKNIFYNKFEIKVYNQNDYKKYVDGNRLKESIFTDKNLFCAIVLDDEEGTLNGDEFYVLNVNVGFYSRNIYDFDFNTYKEKFNIDLNNVIPSSYKISQKNNIKESLDVARSIYASINYLYAINSIVSINPLSALDYIKNVEDVLDDLDQSSYSVLYMKENILVRKFEVKINSLDIYLKSDYQFYDNEANVYILNSINDILVDVIKLMERGYSDIELVYRNLLIENARVLMDLGFYDDAIEIIDNEELISTHHQYGFIIKLLCMNYSDSYSNEEVFKYFKSNRKKFNGKQKEFMLKFVQERYEYDEDDYYVLFIFFLLNKYYKDRILALKLQDSLLDDPSKRYYDILKHFK